MLNRLLNVLYWIASTVAAIIVILSLAALAVGHSTPDNSYNLLYFGVAVGVLVWLLAWLARRAIRYIVFGQATADQ